ncbi:unnamed protein product [Dibothriocephalus latus]|uniref:Uncharacterized protein n=1 Tax=Dibothriocephalus latus TaxID=60516 RepID=A0A3P7M1H7_DIBLA|nr:unnamed protein product [Dibothriocephalus latus]
MYYRGPSASTEVIVRTPRLYWGRFWQARYLCAEDADQQIYAGIHPNDGELEVLPVRPSIYMRVKQQKFNQLMNSKLGGMVEAVHLLAVIVYGCAGLGKRGGEGGV